ncbi:hypothetical protein, partial [Leptospira kirschneri]|uniref:hypothetical protein n=1 Tax=Leptospira kirschneri TaxID=29507 RepID=UPI000C1FB0B1
SVLQRICRNSHRFNIEIQILVGKVMALYGSRSRYVLCIAKMSGQNLTEAFIKFSSVEGIWKSQSYFSK